MSSKLLVGLRWDMATIADKLGHLGELASDLLQAYLHVACIFNNL
jgi:hypothetical protein